MRNLTQTDKAVYAFIPRNSDHENIDDAKDAQKQKCKLQLNSALIINPVNCLNIKFNNEGLFLLKKYPNVKYINRMEKVTKHKF